MIDIHSHILPAFDDGARDLEESLAMARILEDDGVTHIVATPHCHHYQPSYRDDILPRVEELNAQFEKRGVALKVLPGSEIQLRDVQEYQANYDAGNFCHLGDRREYSLLEFPWRLEDAPSGAPELVRWLKARGTTPILAHPERTPLLRENPALLAELVESGALIQLTVDSLTGAHGSGALSHGETIAREYSQVAVLATDAHGVTRSSGLSEGFACLETLCGAAASDDVKNRMNEIERAIASGESR